MMRVVAIMQELPHGIRWKWSPPKTGKHMNPKNTESITSLIELQTIDDVSGNSET